MAGSLQSLTSRTSLSWTSLGVLSPFHWKTITMPNPTEFEMIENSYLLRTKIVQVNFCVTSESVPKSYLIRVVPKSVIL